MSPMLQDVQTPNASLEVVVRHLAFLQPHLISVVMDRVYVST